MEIAIINYNAGNTSSVCFALNRLGYRPVITDDENRIWNADKVIFPGVGQASSAMDFLKKKNLDKVIPELVQPVLGICLGMQLMCSFSEEGAAKCLNIFNGSILKFKMEKYKIPHTGWNTLQVRNSPLFENISQNIYQYFVHSYFLPDSEFSIASCEYGTSFCAAINKNNFYGVQFHPEKSGKDGERILSNFLNL